jgi:hypothetical protein
MDDKTNVPGPPGDDGFGGYGDDQGSRSVIQGATVIRFSNTAIWNTRDVPELPPDFEVVVTEILRVQQRWGPDKMPVGEPLILGPGDPWPDLEALNESVPRSEWIDGPEGKKVGPYQQQYVVRMVDLKTMQRYAYPTGTVGGGICCRELRQSVAMMRRLRGQALYPTVRFGRRFMKTKFGGRQRPDFVIQGDRWIGDGGGNPTLAPSPSPSQPPLKAIAKPTIDEEMNDAIPNLGKPSKPEKPKK